MKTFGKQAGYADRWTFLETSLVSPCDVAKIARINFKAKSCSDVFLAETSASLFEGLNRVVGDGLSAQEWFVTKKSEATPVKLPWEAAIAEELPYER